MSSVVKTLLKLFGGSLRRRGGHLLHLPEVLGIWSRRRRGRLRPESRISWRTRRGTDSCPAGSAARHCVDGPATSSTYSHGHSQPPAGRSLSRKSVLLTSGSVRYTGSVTTLTIGHDVAVADEVLDHGGVLAVGDAVAPDPLRLDVRGVDGQDVAVPLAGREPHPGVRRVFRRMRPAVHPDGSLLLVGADVALDRDELLRVRILLFPDPHLQRTAVDVRGDVDLALMLSQRQARGVPAVGVQPGAVA